MIDKVSNVNNQIPDLKVNQVEGVQKLKDPSPDQQDQLEKKLSKEQIEKVTNSMNDFLNASNTQLVFKFHDKLKEYYVEIVDENTNQVVKEIPPKKLLDIYAAMKDYLGLLVDKKV